MKILFLFILILCSHRAFASYENSCDLVVKLLENTSTNTFLVDRFGDGRFKSETYLISFKGLVKKAQVSGRADTGCQHYLETVIENSFFLNIRYTAMKGQKIKINIRITDFKGKSQSDEIAYTTITTLLLPKRKF
ncbi:MULTISPECIES: hypothetical protein [Acinetobacter]|uniref:hypothetical protein n=1 Tax=Acinetobacter TaxID=469 RepID=UPI0004D3DFEF|nr:MULTISPECIES: hypothetical protein [unclassified Acinetobacter]KEC83711.1 hypothetical protein DT74_13785 [Acinetobacter sp. ETR1]WEE38660.1 hypothetical protein PYV58_17260 [Acinetobacter sp. TAC-1]